VPTNDADDSDDFGLKFVERTVSTALYVAGWIFVGSLVLQLFGFFLLAD